MIGIQGSGKTMLTKIAFPYHAHISMDKNRLMKNSRRHMLLKRYENEEAVQDDLSKNRRIEYVMFHDALRNGENVVIDNTNVSVDIRKTYINLARLYGADVKAVYFKNIQKAYRQNTGRKASLGKKRPGKERLPDYVLDEFHKNLEPPHGSEGFDFIQIMD